MFNELQAKVLDEGRLLQRQLEATLQALGAPLLEALYHLSSSNNSSGGGITRHTLQDVTSVGHTGSQPLYEKAGFIIKLWYIYQFEGATRKVGRG